MGYKHNIPWNQMPADSHSVWVDTNTGTYYFPVGPWRPPYAGVWVHVAHKDERPLTLAA